MLSNHLDQFKSEEYHPNREKTWKRIEELANKLQSVQDTVEEEKRLRTKLSQ